MFSGEYFCKIDEKGRFLVPGPFRKKLDADGGGVVFIKRPDQPLRIYTLPEWEKVLSEIKTNYGDDDGRMFMHMFVSEAATSDLDKTGRILIPGKVRKQIPVEDDLEIVLIGLYHRIEVWNPSEWRRHVMMNEEQFEQQLGKIINLL